MFTVLLRKASGAGYYAMAGLPYDPVVQLSTHDLAAVGHGGANAGHRHLQHTKLDDDFEIMAEDPEERAKIERGMRETEERIEADMDPYKAAAQMDTDEIVHFGELRGWIELFAEVGYQASGYRRLKNPRILVAARHRRPLGAPGLT